MLLKVVNDSPVWALKTFMRAVNVSKKIYSNCLSGYATNCNVENVNNKILGALDVSVGQHNFDNHCLRVFKIFNEHITRGRFINSVALI